MSKRTDFTLEEIELYLACPKKYYYTNILQIKKPRDLASHELVAHRECLYRAGIDPTINYDVHLEMFLDLIDKARPYVGNDRYGRYRTRRTPDKTLRDAKLIAATFHYVLKPPMRELFPWKEWGQERLSLNVDGYNILFAPDCMVGKRALGIHTTFVLTRPDVLYKTIRASVIARSIPTQEKSYALALILSIPEHMLNLVEQTSRLSFSQTWNVIRDCCEGINNEYFPRTNPAFKVCSRQVCEYYGICARLKERR